MIEKSRLERGKPFLQLLQLVHEHLLTGTGILRANLPESGMEDHRLDAACLTDLGRSTAVRARPLHRANSSRPAHPESSCPARRGKSRGARSPESDSVRPAA